VRLAEKVDDHEGAHENIEPTAWALLFCGAQAFFVKKVV
jgi:hypothetical protein